MESYISKKQFMEKHHLSKEKLRQMLPHIEGVKACPCCHEQLIPKDTKPIYIPHKRHYRNNYKKYAYVMDAISLDFQIHPQLTGLNEDVCQTIVEELVKSEAIVLIRGRNPNSLDYCDYMPSAAYISWKDACVKQKNQMVLEILKTFQSLTKFIPTINTT